ncbi:MAG TPA: pilus assembly protein PilM [Candidatus Brocadiia bacterium]|nr:pilus assembly protein PilM [Candidatus Brocadiia bacterium]
MAQSAVKGVLIDSKGGKVRILKTDIVSFSGEPPKQKGDPSRDKRMWKALKTFQERNRIKGDRVVVAIPSLALLINEISVTPVGRRSIEELVAFEAQNQIPFVLDDVVWDYYLFPESVGEGPERHGLLFAVKKATLANYSACFEAAGFTGADEIIPAPLGLLNFINFECDSGKGQLVVDVGAESTQIIGVKGDRFWVRGLSAGGNRVTASLQQRFGLEFDAADNAKRNIRQSKFAEQIHEAIRPQIDSMVGEIFAAYNYMRGHGMEGGFESVHLAGGGAELMGFPAALKRTFGSDVVSTEKFARIAVDTSADAALIKENLRGLLTAVGCALQGAGLGVTRVSLIESRSARAAESAKRNPLWLAGAGVLALSTLILLAMEYADKTAFLGATERETASFMTEYTRLRNEERARKNNAALITECDYLDAVSYGRSAYLEALNALIAQFESLPPGGPRLLLKGVDMKRSDIKEGIFMLSFTADARVAGADSQLTAVNLINMALVEPLRKRPDFIKYRLGQAQFARGSDTVSGIGTEWDTAIVSGKDFILGPDGAWHVIKATAGKTALTISQPYEGENGAIPCAVSNVRFESLDPKTFGFKFAWDMLVMKED